MSFITLEQPLFLPVEIKTKSSYSDGGMDAARLAVVSGKYHQPNKGFLLLFIPEK